MVLSVARGYDPNYLLKEVATGRENYYTDAVADGEPPGVWWGRGSDRVGLAGEVDPQDMTAVYSRFLDPREDGFRDPARWDEVYTLRHTGRAYKSAEQLYDEAIEREPDATPERRDELRTEAGKAERQNVAFLDLTFSPPKSVTVLHTSIEAAEVRARREGKDSEAAEWAGMRAEIEGAIWAGNNAMLAYMQDHAGYVRVGHHGGAAGRWKDAHTWIVASFFQHDSRDHDPQLHIHNALANAAEDDQGVWRTVDSRAVYRHKRAGGAVGDRTTGERLIDSFGLDVAMRPDGKAREVMIVPEAGREMFSSRSGTITPRAREMVTAYEARVGRAATGAEVDRIKREATTATRAAKSHTGETREETLDRVFAEAEAGIKGGMAGIAHAARDAWRARQAERDAEAGEATLDATDLAAQAATRVGSTRRAGERFDAEAVIADAVEAIQAKKATFSRPDVVAVVDDLLPDRLGLPEGADVTALLDGLSARVVERLEQVDQPVPGDEALPADMVKDDGTSAMQAPGGPTYTTRTLLERENQLRAATGHRDGERLTHEQAASFVERLRGEGIELGVDQAAALTGVLTSGARLETLIGPAGTGKSFVVGSLARAWSDPAHREHDADGVAVGPSRRVFGLASAQVATDVLAAEGLTAANVTAWLGMQERLTRARQSGRAALDGDAVFTLGRGDIVVVDESSMADTTALARIHAYVDTVGAKMLLVGDHRQLTAVGAGGAMELVAEAGARYELADARRFTHAWERDASLRLRAGDPTVINEYHRHGRLLDAGTVADAEASGVRGWLADTLAGRRSLLIVDTNDAAARCSESIRAELVQLGHVAELGVPLRDNTFAGVGDVVAGRRVAWELAGYEGNRRGPVNRERYRVLAVRADGGLEVEVLDRRDHLLENAPTPAADGGAAGPVRERLVLPPEYVADHTTLAYAATHHAVEGATVQTSHTVATPNTSVNAFYVGGSRAEQSNTFHVVTRTAPADAAQGGDEHTVHRDPRAVACAVLDTREAADAANRSATAAVDDATVWARSVRTGAERFGDAAHQAVLERTARHLDELCAAELLGPQDRARIAAEDGTAALARILRQAELAGHDPRHVLREAVTDSLDGARQVSDVIRGRIRTHTAGFDPIPATWTGRVPTDITPAYATYLDAIATPLDGRTAELGAQAAADPAPWLLDALGPVPPAVDKDGADNSVAVAAWKAGAGAIQAHRELAGLPTDHHQPTATDDSPAGAAAGGRPARRTAYLDAADLLGSAPGRNQAENYAAYRDAHRSASLPDYTRDALEHSPAWHRAMVRSWQHTKAWGPAYVENMLAGTRQAEAHHRGEAELGAADSRAAEAGGDTERHERLTREAREHAALADTLAHTAAQLDEVAQERGRFLARTATTRVQGEASEAYLAAQGLSPGFDDLVTGEEWLALHERARIEDDAHRPITATDLTEYDERAEPADHTDDANDHRGDAAPDHQPRHKQQDREIDEAHVDARGAEAPRGTSSDDERGDHAEDEDAEHADDVPRPVPADAEPDDADERRERPAPDREDAQPAPEPVDEAVGENTVPDVRELAAAERDGLDEDSVHVPDVEETAHARRLAKDAAIEWRNRAALDARHEAEEQESERGAQLARWHDADHGDVAAAGDTSDPAGDASDLDDAEPVDEAGYP